MPKEGVALSNDLLDQIKVAVSWDGIGCSIDDAGSCVVPENSVAVSGLQPSFQKTNTLTEPLPTIKHKWDKGRVKLEPTCSQTGIREYACGSCGATRDAVIPTSDEHRCAASGTVYDNLEDYVGPSAGKAGIRRPYCTDCNATQVLYYSTVHFETNGGEAIEDVEVQNAERNAETPLALTQSAVKNGYVFSSWCSDEELTCPISEMSVLGYMTAYARWERLSTPVGPVAAAYRVEHYKQRLDGGYDLADSELLYGPVGSEAQAAPRDYEHFHVNAAASTLRGEVSAPEGADGGVRLLVLEVRYDLDEVEVSYDFAGGRDPEGNASAARRAPWGSEEELLAAPSREGFAFAGWSDGSSTMAAGSLIKLEGDVSLTAVWEPIGELEKNESMGADDGQIQLRLSNPTIPGTGDYVPVGFLAVLLVASAATLIIASKKHSNRRKGGRFGQ